MGDSGHSGIVQRSRAIDSVLFNAGFAIYLVYRSVRWSSGAEFGWLIDGYLADVLALPVVLAITEDLLRFLKGDHHRLSGGMIIFAWIYISVIMEWVAPYYTKNAVADYYDVFAYGLGALIFYFFGRSAAVSRHSE